MSVVITGMAIWSPYGRGLETFWQGLISGKSARKPVTRFDVENWVYRTKTAATIEEIGTESSGCAESNAIEILSAVIADALEDAEISKSGDVPPYETAICLGSSQNVTKVFSDHLRQKRGEAVPPDAFSNYSWVSAGSILSTVARQTNAQGAAMVVSTACASGTSSIGIGYDWIRHGRAQRVFAGGIGFFSELSFSGFNILRLTAREGCRSFDVARDGMMFGDGFALVVLENEELARRRGAKIWGRILGYATANEAFHPTSPDPEGSAGFRVMWQALRRDAGILSKLDYINAHGTGTLVNDTAELKAIQKLVALGENKKRVAVSSTKGHHGHSLGAAGSVEFVATALALKHQQVPPTLGLETPEAGFDKIDLIQTAQPHPIRVALSNSFAFGGNVAAIAVEHVEITGENEQ